MAKLFMLYGARNDAKSHGRSVKISIQTSFDWRHKILSSLYRFVPETLSGTVESDELELALNNKGKRDLERKSRKRGTDFKRNNQEPPTLKHKTFIAKDHINKDDKKNHVQTVNNKHKKSKQFLDSFNGVSLKYLQNTFIGFLC